MSSIFNPRIQIAPVGFEIDRITIPAQQYKADIVYLLVHNNVSADKSTRYADEIKKKLDKMKIKTELVYANRTNLLEIVRTVKDIIVKHRKSDIYINVASGSKIHAIGCMMGCMIFDNRKNLKPFYAEAAKYPAYGENDQQTYGVKEIHPLPTYQMQTPRPYLLKALSIIKKYERIKKSDLAELAKKEGIIDVNSVENYKQARFTALDKKIITPLKEIWGFIDEDKVGKNRYVFLTEDGKLASEFLF